MSAQRVLTKNELVHLLKQSRELGFLSDQSIEKQIAHSTELISFFPPAKRAIDLGAGGGLPCLVWLHLDNSTKIYALDAMRKRTDFLSSAISSHPGIADRFEVINSRAESLAHDIRFRETFDLVVARGFGPPASTAECATGFLQLGGHLVVSGRPEAEIDRWDKTSLRKLGLEIVDLADGNLAHAIIIKKASPAQERYPRNAASLKNKALWTLQ